MAKKVTKKELKAEKAAMQQTHNSDADTTGAQKPVSAFKDKKNIVWVVLAGAMAITISSLLFLPQTLGAGITSVYSLMLWWGLFGMFLFGYIDKKRSYGFIAGSVFGMLFHILSPLLIALT